MAKYVRALRGDFNTILKKIESGVMGGSRGLFFKVNTWGEEAFLDTLKELF